MNESFMRKVYENPTENVMQQGLNFTASSSRALSRPFRPRIYPFSLRL